MEDHREEQPRCKVEEQWDRRVRDSIGADDDQDDPKRYRGKMIRGDKRDALCMIADRAGF